MLNRHDIRRLARKKARKDTRAKTREMPTQPKRVPEIRAPHATRAKVRNRGRPPLFPGRTGGR